MNNILRIVFVVPILAPYAIPRYRELASIENTEVHVVIERNTDSERPGWSFLEVEGVHMHLLDRNISYRFKQKNRNSKYALSKRRIFSFGLKRIIRKINPDIVLVCNAAQILMLNGFRKYKLGVIVEDTLRSVESQTAFNRFIKRMLLKRADFYLPFTQDAIEFLHHNGITKPFIKSSWSMDVDFFTDLTLEEKQEKKRCYGMNGKINFVLVASLIPRKGILQFLNGWAEMPEQFHIDAKLFLLGDGELKENIIEEIKKKCLNNVFLLGNVSYKEVSYYLQCGDIFVLPTLEDLCSLAVLEAMAGGCPVLTTIYNGAREFVEDGVNGFIFDPLNKESIIRVLNMVLISDIDAMSMASEEKIKSYSTQKVMSELRHNLNKEPMKNNECLIC